MTQHIDKALAIISRTNDGNDLSPPHLALLESVVNHGEGNLTPLGKETWDKMYSDVLAGTYKKPWLHGQEHLTKNHDGYVLWKGKTVEHYSYRDAAAEATAAKELATVCRTIEARGQEVTWGELPRVYDEARFGQGMTTPRFTVLWHFDDQGATIEITPQTTTDVNEFASIKEKARLALSEKLGLSPNSGSVRALGVCSKEQFLALHENIESDIRWARYAWQMDSCHQLKELPALVNQQIDIATLADAHDLSMHVLAPGLQQAPEPAPEHTRPEGADLSPHGS